MLLRVTLKQKIKQILKSFQSRFKGSTTINRGENAPGSSRDMKLSG